AASGAWAATVSWVSAPTTGAAFSAASRSERRGGGRAGGAGPRPARGAVARGAVDPAPALAAGAGGGTRRGRLLLRELTGGDVALVDPHLDADPAERRAGLVEAVVDVGPQRVQRDATLAVELGARHLGALQTAGALNPDALR